ncbi:MAG TPA: helix-turn-helix domain-containing protein [Terracidiphilus sp.]|nr:helix-turn-helix domain-containing protein [Terracidiphilus sp.]
MSRPKSDSKRKAILEAAKKLIAERGAAHTPTSAISKAAGIAEGSLFVYFASKDELLNELYLEMRKDFDRNLTNYPTDADAKTRLRYVWDTFVDLGVGQPSRLTVMRQIRATGMLLKENETPGKMVIETLNATRDAIRDSDHGEASVEFMVLLLRAHAEATIEYIVAHPEQEAHSRELGFELIWRGLKGR